MSGPTLESQHKLFRRAMVVALRYAQAQRKISSMELARQIGLSPSLVFEVLSHRTDSYEALVLLADALDVDLAQIVDG